MTPRTGTSMLQEWTGDLSLGFQVPVSLYKIMDRDMCMVTERGDGLVNEKGTSKWDNWPGLAEAIGSDAR